MNQQQKQPVVQKEMAIKRISEHFSKSLDDALEYGRILSTEEELVWLNKIFSYKAISRSFVFDIEKRAAILRDRLDIFVSKKKERNKNE